MAEFEALKRVEWSVPDPYTRKTVKVLPAIVIQQSAKRVFIRATAPDGRWLFRWVSHRELREAERVEG